MSSKANKDRRLSGERAEPPLRDVASRPLRNVRHQSRKRVGCVTFTMIGIQ